MGVAQEMISPRDDSILNQLFKLRGTDDVQMTGWIERKNSGYITADIQNKFSPSCPLEY